MNMKKQKTSQKGFTLLLAALVASIVLSIGTAVFSIAQKEVELSATGRDSQFAFYAADTAAECALYWDDRYQYFAAANPYSGTPECDGQSFTAQVVSGTRASGTFTMSFSYAPRGYCAQVSVAKTRDSISGASTSTIHADGYSTDCASITTDSQALQRSVELRY